MNEQIFFAINNLAGHWQFLDEVGIFFAEKFLYIFALIVVLLWFYKPVRHNVYVAIIASGVGRLVIVELLKRIVNHPRPYEIMSNMHQLLVDNDHGVSFPSGHTVVYMSFAFAFCGTKFFWPFLILATFGSVARVYVGVHFPYDVIASIAIAGLVVAITRGLFKRRVLR